MSLARLEVRDRYPTKKAQRLVLKAQKMGLATLNHIEIIDVYKLKSQRPLESTVSEFFVDPILQEGLFGAGEFKLERPISYVAEVFYRPGVTDNSAHSAEEALRCAGVHAKAACGKIYFFSGDNLDPRLLDSFCQGALANPLIEQASLYSFEEWRGNHWNYLDFPEVDIHHNSDYEVVSLNRSDEELLALSSERCLALTLDELHFVRDHFNDQAVKNEREKLGLPESPTDVELEVIAQSWSEHCKHKIFAAHIDYQEGELPKGMKRLGSHTIDSLFKSKIRKATNDVKEKFQIPWLVSVFSDNAGIVRFDPELDLCIKVETHNSPSALDPYGGALTGILGVNRDILGCGYGARPVANMDVFCFASPDYPLEGEEAYMPEGLLTPAQLLEGVHQGVEDGGNKSGIPTINGAIHFDQDYAGKPLVFVGTVGAMPNKLKSGTATSEKNAAPGDRIYMVGGAIGADGIHGATFSSLELNENSPSTAVQIGDPLTQKRVMDFLLEARDLELFSCVTDNGAGGLSSSIGEMATLTGGAELDLALAPTKYQGLAPWELMISESQERMSFAVPKSCAKAFEELAQRRGVSATDLGEFTSKGELEIFYKQKLVGSLNLHWLHEALPQMKLEARYEGPRARSSWRPELKREAPGEFNTSLLHLLSSPNIASKEGLIRRYDHEVGAATALKPLGGVKSHGPNDCGALWLGAIGGSEDAALSVGCGLAPKYSLVDPYLMALRSVDECVRGMVGSGADINRMCLLDNFCWPDPVKSPKNPDGDLKLGELVRTSSGLYDICLAYGLPLVSGKDSMKNDYRGKNKAGETQVISILPTLLVTGMSYVPMKNLCDTSFKNVGDVVYLLGHGSADGLTLAASEFSSHYKVEGEEENQFHQVNLEDLRARYEKIFKAHSLGLIHSSHDISEGGLAVALAESMIGPELGVELESRYSNLKDHMFWFGESMGSFVMSAPKERASEFEALFKDECQKLGVVTSDFNLTLEGKQILAGTDLKSAFLSRWP